jgi:hypothetical protein
MCSPAPRGRLSEIVQDLLPNHRARRCLLDEADEVTAGLEPEMQLTLPILLGDAIRLETPSASHF